MASNLLLLRRLSRLLKPPPSLSSIPATRVLSLQVSEVFCPSSAAPSHPSGNFCSHSFNLNDGSQGPSPIDYRSLMQEDNFHRLANATIHYLQEKFEEYGDIVQIDGFDVDYGNEVLTLKVGPLGTYVLNKQTPNRQIWLSSPVSGPSRFDWDESSEAWVYRRTRANLTELLENELEKLCGQPIALS